MPFLSCDLEFFSDAILKCVAPAVLPLGAACNSFLGVFIIFSGDLGMWLVGQLVREWMRE